MLTKKEDEMLNKTWTKKEDLGSGIIVYRDVLTNVDVIDRLENTLKNSDNPSYIWREALVGYAQRMPDYRDCVDFKYKRTDIDGDSGNTADILRNLWDDVYAAKLPAVQDYCRQFNIGGELKYWESFNFIKYGPGQHFQEHHDHGFSYNCVVSLVGYPNDDYEGGELYFRLQNLNIKPKAGDLYIFPSNYMYPHRAMPVTSGTKYSIVTMLDYSSKFHNPQFYQETGD